MSLPDPEITVVISTYDDRDFVAKKLVEIEAQSAFNRAEFIFIESASPGLERELLEPFCDRHANCKLIDLDGRVNLYQAWNLGWEAANAPLVCISNMDDTMHPQLLEEVISAMELHPWDLASVLIAKQNRDSDWNSWERTRLRKLELSTRPGPFFVWRSELKERIGMFDSALQVAGDKDFWARALNEKLRIGLIEEVLYLYTKHAGQLSKGAVHAEQEKALLEAKSYPHVWPKDFQAKIRRVRLRRKLPW
ncbi:MAG: glycosyltransferase family 2 protein [Opitutaceae bacterium]